MIGLGYERSHNRTADRTTPARRSEYVFASAALTLLRIHPKSPRVSRRSTTHESLMRMVFFACHSVAPPGARMARLNQLFIMEGIAFIVKSYRTGGGYCFSLHALWQLCRQQVPGLSEE